MSRYKQAVRDERIKNTGYRDKKTGQIISHRAGIIRERKQERRAIQRIARKKGERLAKLERKVARIKETTKRASEQAKLPPQRRTAQYRVMVQWRPAESNTYITRTLNFQDEQAFNDWREAINENGGWVIDPPTNPIHSETMEE